jgi:hypothetical protein
MPHSSFITAHARLMQSAETRRQGHKQKGILMPPELGPHTYLKKVKTGFNYAVRLELECWTN